jgi:hypothetical protein
MALLFYILSDTLKRVSWFLSVVAQQHIPDGLKEKYGPTSEAQTVQT